MHWQQILLKVNKLTKLVNLFSVRAPSFTSIYTRWVEIFFEVAYSFKLLCMISKDNYKVLLLGLIYIKLEEIFTQTIPWAEKHLGQLVSLGSVPEHTSKE